MIVNSTKIYLSGTLLRNCPKGKGATQPPDDDNSGSPSLLGHNDFGRKCV